MTEVHIVIETAEYPDEEAVNDAVRQATRALEENHGVVVKESWELKP